MSFPQRTPRLIARRSRNSYMARIRDFTQCCFDGRLCASKPRDRLAVQVPYAQTFGNDLIFSYVFAHAIVPSRFY
jgi:hypothetical protein